MKIIAHIYTDFDSKFGLPRQSGLAPITGKIVFEPTYRVAEAFRGLEDYSHIWLLWEFSEAKRDGWSPTVRPPRLGGNKRMGVFATRSPFRPNPVGLSSVKLERIEFTKTEGPVLWVSGVDLMNGTPIYDIKPYLPFTDSHPKAKGGFADEKKGYSLQVEFPPQLLGRISAEKQAPLLELLSQDPRPQYIEDPTRVYGFAYAGAEVRFTVNDGTLTVVGVETK